MARPFINVKLFGALGDGATDDTQAILNAIKSIPTLPSTEPKNAGPVLYFPEGIYLINATLTIERFFGLEIAGTGVHPVENISDVTITGSNGPRSVLIWNGTSSGTMMELRGVQGTTVRDLTFLGKRGTTGTRADRLLELTSLDGKGSSWIAIKNCHFRDAVTGIMCGGSSEKTDSEVLIERVTFSTCDTGFKLTHPQNQNYLFNMLGANNCKCVIDADEGGGVNVQTAALHNCGGSGTNDYAFKFGAGVIQQGGGDVGISVLNAVRHELTTKLLRVAGYVRVTCDGFNQSSPAPSTSGSPLIKLSNGALVFRNCRWQFAAPKILEFVTPTPSGAYCTVRFDHCEFPFFEEAGDPPRFPVLSVILNPAQARCYYSFFRCDGPGHIPLPDLKSAW
ncbi:MAG: glycosyl hydrolase family 28-related protein [Phycisphaerales bacterium]